MATAEPGGRDRALGYELMGLLILVLAVALVILIGLINDKRDE